MLAWTIALVCLFLLLLIGYFRLLHLIYHREPTCEEVHYTTTEDGARIALYRYFPERDKKGSLPILFCHGLGSDHHNFDLDDKYSWARHFASQGFESWVIDLRGAGRSKAPHRWKWCFDGHLLDARAAVKHIQKKSGSEKIHWIGHSMGGMVLYAYLGVYPDDHGIQSGVILASPVKFYTTRGFRLTLALSWLLHILPKAPLSLVVRLLIPFTRLLVWMPSFLRKYIPKGILPLNPDNVELGDLKYLAYNLVHSPSSKIFLQFRHWLWTGNFCSFDGEIDYQENMKKIDIPLLVVSGAADKVAHKKSVAYALELLPEENLQYQELSKEQGFSADYGHGDVVFGEKAQEEVLPLALDWIVQQEKTTSKASSSPGE